MYLIFPPEYDGLADAVYNRASNEYQYTTKLKQSGLSRTVGVDELLVTTYDMEKARSEQDVSEYRWEILRAMSKGAVFVHFDNISEAHFYTPEDTVPLEDQITKILVAGKYAETRAKHYKEASPKASYVGPTYVNPLTVIVTSYDAKKEEFNADYDPKIPPVLSSLPEDLWAKTGFTTARMAATLSHLLDEFYDSALVTFDLRVSRKIDSHEHFELKAPKIIDLEFGIEFNNIVKRKEVEEEV